MGLVEDIRDDGLEGTDAQRHHRHASRTSSSGPGRRSSWPANFGLACCAIEMMATGGAHYDLVPLRHGGVPGLAAAGRHHDRRRPGQPEDGARAAPGLRPDDGAEVGHLDGRLRIDRRHVQQLRHRAGRRPDRARSTSTPRAARRRPRRCIHAIETLHELIETGELMQPAVGDRRGRRHPRHRDPVAGPVPVSLGESECPTSRRRRRRGDRAAGAARRSHGCPVVDSLGQTVLHVPRRAATSRLVKALADDGYDDVRRPHRRRLPRHPGRAAARRGRPPSASRSSSTCSTSRAGAGAALRRAGAGGRRRRVPSLFDVHPGTEAMEREVFDMFGIALRRSPRPHPHPDARGLGRPPAAQGLRDRADPRAVQGTELADDAATTLAR